MTELKPNAETYRVRSLAYLVTKDVRQARLEIRKALELEPRWESIRFTTATIDYFSALGTPALPGRVVPWPEPVNWALVKRDDESLTRLREASKVFRELAEEPGKQKDERQTLESWCLACLLNDPERQEEATAYCQRILQTDPAHFRAIPWVMARNLDIDLNPSQRALNALVTKGKAKIPHIIALLGCYLMSGKPKKAIRLLEKTKAVFQKHNMDTVWTFWEARSLLTSGDPEGAVKVIDNSGLAAELRGIRTLALRELCKKTGDWRQLISHLESSFEETRNSVFLYESCELMAQQRDWIYVADRAQQLVEELGTAEALRLAAVGSYNAKRFDLCLSLLDDHRNLFSHGKLPGELRRIRVLCQQAMGVLPKAIVEAETLAREEPTAENLLALAHLYFAKGDLKGLALLARQLKDRPDIAVEHLLGIAQLVQGEDRELAISLWRQADRQGIPDEMVGSAVSLGFQLGRDRELGPLLEKMEKLGREGRGGIQVATIDDLASFAARQRKRGLELDEFYRNGMVPIHMIMALTPGTLADLYHRVLSENESAPDPTRQFFLLARHGGRPLMPGFPKIAPNWRLNLDVTAILLAAHLEILDEVERCFQPLRIPAKLVPSLIQMRDRTVPQQPSRLRVYKQIVDLTERGSMQGESYVLPPGYQNTKLVEELGEQWVAPFESARGSGGFLVDFLPLRKRDLSGPPSTLPEDADQHLVNCRSIAQALRQQGPLSAEEYLNVLRALGEEGRKKATGAVPREGSLLICHGTIPEVLAEAKLLHIMCERFQVCIERRELDRVTAELQGHNRRRTLARWLEKLIDRVRQGIDYGTYEVIPSPPHEKGKLEGGTSQDFDYHCLLTLLQFETRQGDVIWADDRCLNSYPHGQGVPIIGINEILKSLVSVNALKLKEYYRKLCRLRTANVRFIPVQKDEILHHLREAKVKEQTVVETGELSVLRRYVAACLLQGDILQKPPMPQEAPNKNGEVAFIVGLARAIIDAIVGVWASEKDAESACQARAEWLLSNLYIDHLGLSNLTSLSKSDQDEDYLVAVTLAGLIGQAMIFSPKRAADESIMRRRYFDWLSRRILSKRIDADPHLVAMITDILKKTLFSAQKAAKEKGPEPVVMALLQAFYEDLPKAIREELWRDTDFMTSIGLRPLAAITIDGFNFDPDEFYRAVGEAINGREVTIIPINSDSQVGFHPFEDHRGRGGFCFDDPVTGSRKVGGNEVLELLLESPVEREAALRRNRLWFDCPNKVLDRVIAEIVSIEEPRRRIEEAVSWQNSSAAIYYTDLHRKLSQRRGFKSNELLPQNAEGLVRHFRLKPDIGPGVAFQNALAISAETLISEEGLQTAIERLVGLPVPLPPSLIKAVEKLSEQDRRALIKRLLRTAPSPLSKMHFVYLLLHFGDKTSAFRRLARWAINNLLSTTGTEEFEAFLAILKWVNEEFGHWPEARAWPSHIKLAMVWSHAHRLFSIFRSAGAPNAWLREIFEKQVQRIPHEAFERDPNYWFDIAHPRLVSRVTFTLGGLSYSLSEKAKVFIDKKLRERFANLAFPEVEGMRPPALPLVRDTTRSRDGLGSFLGGDFAHRLSALLGSKNASKFKQSALKELVEQAASRLGKTSDELSAWARIHAVLGDLPPEQHLAVRLKKAISQTDFVGLFEKNANSGFLALLAASLQAINLGDQNLRCHLKDQLVRTSKILAQRESGETGRDTRGEEDFSESWKAFLFESALNISIAAQPSGDVIAEFADLLTQIVKNWHSIIPTVKPIVQRLCEELPVRQAQQFWPLLIGLRADVT